MSVRRFGKFLAVGLAVGVIAGWLITGDQMTIGQTDGSGWQDKTFALAQHPTSGVPVGEWLPFDFRHKDDTSLTIWDGGPYEKRALVSVWCGAGTVKVYCDAGEVTLNATGDAAEANDGLGNTTTVYSAYVEVKWVGAWTSTPSYGRYAITVDIGD